MEPHDWIKVVGTVVATVLGIGAIYHRMMSARMDGHDRELRQMREVQQSVQTGYEAHLRELGSLATGLRDLKDWMVRLDKKLETLLQNGRRDA
jgi:Na+/H+ antiporter NhaB